MRLLINGFRLDESKKYPIDYDFMFKQPEQCFLPMIDQSINDFKLDGIKE